jgi:hypothetical protein
MEEGNSVVAPFAQGFTPAFGRAEAPVARLITARVNACPSGAVGRSSLTWSWSGGEVEGGEGGDDFLGFEGDGDDLADEAEDVAFVFVAVGVVGDVGAGVGGDAVLVDDPFEGGAVAEAVVEGGGWDAAEGEGFVVAEFGFVFAEGHLFGTRSLKVRLIFVHFALNAVILLTCFSGPKLNVS